MTYTLKASSQSWPMDEPFVIARGARDTADVLVIELSAGNATGRGEAAGVSYAGETLESLLQDVEGVRDAIEAGASRQELLNLLPAGGARNAVDSAMWDIEAKLSGTPAWQLAGMDDGKAVTTAITIGIRSLPEYTRAALALADHPWIKVKVDQHDPLAAVAAVRDAAPNAKLIVDANQAWTVEELKQVTPALLALKVDLLEQPVKVGQDDALLGYKSPIPLCADESINTADDLAHLVGRYDFINIKLDKTGGLTKALELAHAAQALGFRLMSGCMWGSSLAMAPAMVLAQMCEINDLDAPVLQAEDWPDGIHYERGHMSPPWPQFWG